MIKGKLYLVSTPIGNLSDITYRAVEVLGEVDYIICEDTRVTRKLLNHYSISKPLISFHSKSSRAVVSRIIEMLETGKNLALVSDSGTPIISDPGCVITREAVKKEIDIVPIPGPSAVHSAIVCSGYCVSSYHFHGFISPKSGRRKRKFEEIKGEKTVHVFYESPHRLLNFLKDLQEVLGNIQISVSKEMTKLYEKSYRGRIGSVIKEIMKDGVKGEYTIVVNNAVGNRQNRNKSSEYSGNSDERRQKAVE